MGKGIVQRGLALSAVMCLTVTGFTGCSKDSKNEGNDKAKNVVNDANATGDATGDEQPAEQSADLAFEPYEETVNYTFGATVAGNVQWPKDNEEAVTLYPELKNDDLEQNAYTRLYKKILNVQSSSYWTAADGEDYNTKLTTAITTGELPDVFTVTAYTDYKELVEGDRLADLTDAYNTYASPLMREIYDSYNGLGITTPLEMATIDGRIYSLPTCAPVVGPELFWVRQDWLDELNIAAPSTFDDVENILTQFVEKNVGGKGNVGLCLRNVPNDLFCGAYAGAYETNNLFTCNGGFPKQWVRDDAGNVTYGSILPGCKQGLAKLADWYQKGIVDKNFMQYTTDDGTKELISSGKCGAAFAGFWFGYRTSDSYANDKNADWKPYMISNGDGKVTGWQANTVQNYHCVNKNFEHPELLVKVKNVSLKYNQSAEGRKDDSQEALEYRECIQKNLGVNPIGAFDYADADYRTGKHVIDAVAGSYPVDDLTAYENDLYTSVKKYNEAVEKGEKPSADDWLNNNVRIVGTPFLADQNFTLVNSLFSASTDSWDLYWTSLQDLEEKTYLQIITGDKPVDYFDEFVEQWKEQGGDTITEEVAEIVNARAE